MTVTDQEDFTYIVSVPRGVTLHFREVTPRDFYLGQVLRQQERSYLELLLRLMLTPEEVLDDLSVVEFRTIIKWAGENLLEEKLFTVENWLETAFHLCKQRWDNSIDWIETQPMSKVLTMVTIMNKFHEDQSDQMKKNSRKKR